MWRPFSSLFVANWAKTMGCRKSDQLSFVRVHASVSHGGAEPDNIRPGLTCLHLESIRLLVGRQHQYVGLNPLLQSIFGHWMQISPSISLHSEHKANDKMGGLDIAKNQCHVFIVGVTTFFNTNCTLDSINL